MSELKDKEKGVALDRQEEVTPEAVDYSSSDNSILQQEALINQGNTDEYSEKAMENTDVADLEEDDSVFVGGTAQGDPLGEEDDDQNCEIISSTTGLIYKGGNVGRMRCLLFFFLPVLKQYTQRHSPDTPSG